MSLRLLRLATLSLSAVPLLAANLNVVPAQAFGVRCPRGYRSTTVNGTLRCSRVNTFFANTICPAAYPTMTIRRGFDRCTSVNPPWIGAPTVTTRPVCTAAGRGWRIQTDRIGNRDRCTRRVTQFVPPVPAF